MARKKKALPEELFSEWWKKVEKKVSKREAHEMTYEMACRAFLAGYNGDRWSPGMGDSLFCDLDDIIGSAYLAGKESIS